MLATVADCVFMDREINVRTQLKNTSEVSRQIGFFRLRQLPILVLLHLVVQQGFYNGQNNVGIIDFEVKQEWRKLYQRCLIGNQLDPKVNDFLSISNLKLNKSKFSIFFAIAFFRNRKE